MPVFPTGDDSVYSEEVSGAQHSPKIPGILESLKDEPQLLRVVARARLCGLIARPGSQGAHLHADALMHLVAAQGVQFLPPGPQDRDAPGLGHPEQLGPLPLQPSFTRLEQKPGHTPAVGPARRARRHGDRPNRRSSLWVGARSSRSRRLSSSPPGRATGEK